jgi:hypothetical protein
MSNDTTVPFLNPAFGDEMYLTSITLSGRRQLEWPVGDGFSLGWGFRFYFSFF